MIIYLLTLLAYLVSALILGPECSVPIPQWPGHYIVLLGGAGWVSALLTVIVTFPAVAVAVRRLHDQGRSGWWLLILPLLLPWFGYLVFIAGIGVFSGPGVAGPNRYGPDPRGNPKALRTPELQGKPR